MFASKQSVHASILHWIFWERVAITTWENKPASEICHNRLSSSTSLKIFFLDVKRSQPPPPIKANLWGPIQR